MKYFIMVFTVVITTLSLMLVIPQGAGATPAAGATPEIAKQWGAACSSCHIGAPTALGEEGIAFKLAGYDNGVAPKNPLSWYFLSFVSELMSFAKDSGEAGEVSLPESAELFSLIRLDKAGRAKIFVIGEFSYKDQKFDLEFAHGHLQLNPLEKREQLNLRAGNIEPATRLWNTDMRRMFETPLWGGVDTAAAELSGGGDAHHGGGSVGRPGVIPGAGWGADASSVLGRNWLLAGGFAGENVYGGIFRKFGGRGFDNSTTSLTFEDLTQMSPDEQKQFGENQVLLARKWERSVVFGVSTYSGYGSRDVFNAASLSMVMDPAEMVMDHNVEEEDGHDDDDDGMDDMDHMFMPARTNSTLRFVGDMNARWDRYGFYLVGVYGANNYTLGDPEHWEEHGEFESTNTDSRRFFAWSAEASLRFAISQKLTGRFAVRYEELSPESYEAVRFQRATVNLTVPIRIMRPALWTYLEASRNFTLNGTGFRAGLKFAF